MLVGVDEGLGPACDDIAGKYNFASGKVNHEVATGVRRRPVEPARTGGERGFLFLLVVLMSDDREARWKGDQAIDVISAAVRENHRGHRFRRDFSGRFEQFLSSGRRGLGVDDDYAFSTDSDPAVSAAARAERKATNGAGAGACAADNAAKAVRLRIDRNGNCIRKTLEVLK